MHYQRGDRVNVKGYNGAEGVARIWAVVPRGFVLCSERGYQILLKGQEAAQVGYPASDVIGLADNSCRRTLRDVRRGLSQPERR